ncbi:ATP-binding cassette domain-containing protein [Actinomadura fulvescens]|uniref:Daunorubicin resistance protein DrrA family ABC transporter ATP-binding protein n=1 Tax=Actinomadura fulvescens TaxID=46160 RepID=A0ABP6CHP5_9ACTN
MTRFAIEAEGLRKRYGDTHALAGFDLAVAEGTVCGLLGPNGAGKTTAVRILSTLLLPDGGTARVAGFDVVGDSGQVRYRIGLAGQQPSVDEILTGRENLRMWARLFRLRSRDAKRRTDELLEWFGLADAADKRVKHYSGGMRRRLDLAASFILRPQVLFLDEPTTGLDPRSRTEVWRAVRELVAQGTTVLLTTQYLEEADRLAHQIAVLDAGAVIADGSPNRLKSMIGGDQIDVVLRDAADVPSAAEIIARVADASPEIDPDSARVTAPVKDPLEAITVTARELRDAGLQVEDLTLRRPTLDEVFLSLTGRAAGGDGDAGADGADGGRPAEEKRMVRP